MSESRAASQPVSPWLWVPTLYFAQGLPNGLLEDIAPALFKNLGVDNKRITHALALAALPWMLKAFWSPLVDAYGTKRRWIWLGQLVCAFAFAGFALTPFWGNPVAAGFACLTLVALCSATHDIAADGFYLFGVRTGGEQSFFSGIRNTTFRLAKFFSASGIVILAGLLMGGGSSPDSPGWARWLRGQLGAFRLEMATAWACSLAVIAVIFVLLALWHLIVMPRPAEDKPVVGGNFSLVDSFVEGWRTFFKKPKVGRLLFFILFYRLSETLLSALATPFLMDAREAGGLGLDTLTLGWLNSVGVGALLVGGILGGVLVSRFGLCKMLWPMVAVMHLPNLAFLALAHWRPENLRLIAGALLTEKFGYGFGMCAIMLYLIYVCTGERRVTHYAICTGFMVLGAKGFSYFAGDIQQAIGYTGFFWVVLGAIFPGLVATWMVRGIAPGFGRKAA